MTALAVAAFCLVLLVLAFVFPRLSRHPERGAQRVLGQGHKGSRVLPRPLSRWFSRSVSTSQRAVGRSGAAGRRGRGKLPG
ncbi:MAG: DUF6411 family protein [Actinomycetes bacterium]